MAGAGADAAGPDREGVFVPPLRPRNNQKRLRMLA